MPKQIEPVIVWQPQSRQALFMSRSEDEALYGGAAGGGKSDALVMEATRQVHIPYYRGLIVRRTYPQLEDLIGKSLRLYPHAFPGAKYNDSKHIWHFPSGAVITSSTRRTSITIRASPMTSSQKQVLAKKFALYGFGVDLS